MSTLFDQQLRKQQQTNYETQSTTQEATGQQTQQIDVTGTVTLQGIGSELGRLVQAGTISGAGTVMISLQTAGFTLPFQAPVSLTSAAVPASGLIHGAVLYSGPRPTCRYDGELPTALIGNAVLLMFHTNNPPPPAGSATSASSAARVNRPSSL